MTKAELRLYYKQKRLGIDPRQKLRMDDLLLIKFQQMYFPQVSVLLTYWPHGKYNEPNTHLFSGYLRHTIPGLETSYPVIDDPTGHFNAVAVTEDTLFTTNKYGINEPKDGIIIDPQEIDLVFVPLLAADMQGYRVGYGKGFYDKYLGYCRQDVLKVGFNYFAPVDKINDAQLFDIPLNYLVTTEDIYEF